MLEKWEDRLNLLVGGILMLNKVAKVEVTETLQSVPTAHSQNIKQREVETAVDINTTNSAKTSNPDNANNYHACC